MEKSGPLISIKIASYNHARFVGEAIQSVLDQSYQNFELIIVDDCSVDDSVDVIRSFHDPRIHLIVNKQNLGAPATSRKAKTLCQGKYFCSLDSDDYFHPDKLAVQVAYMEEHPDVDVVATFVQEIDEFGKFNTNCLTANWFNHALNFNEPKNWLWENHICHSSVLIRKAIHDEVWDYESGLHYTNDWNNWIRLLAAGARFAVVPQRLVYYRRHEGNITSRNPERAYWEYAFISSKVLHPYLDRLKRNDLIQDNLLRFLKDMRYPVDVVQRNNFLELLLGFHRGNEDFESIWKQPTARTDGLRNERHEAFHLVEILRQECVASESSIESLRQELHLAENELFKLARLRSVWQQEALSPNKLAKLGYISFTLVCPDILRIVLRRIIHTISHAFRSYRHPGVEPYRARIPLATNKEKRVLHVIANFMAGGSSQLVVDILERLGESYQQKVLTAFVPFPRAYIGVPIYEYRGEREIYNLIRDFEPDIVHIHYWGESNWAWYDKVFRVADRLRCKVIENVNTPVKPYRCRAVRQYVYVSKFVMQSFGRLGEAAEVIYPGTNTQHYSSSNVQLLESNCVGMVYRLEPDKLNQQSIDVLIAVARRKPGTKMIIVGDGSLLSSYKNAARASGVEDSFSFVGAKSYSELPSLYARMSVFVAPVWNESFGQVSCFAMSMGIPVVGYRVGGLPEIVGNDDMLVTPGDTNALASLIIKLLEDKKTRDHIGEQNRNRANTLFPVELMISKYSDLYRKVINGQ